MMDGVVFLAARTVRSQAYAQALAVAGLHPAHTVLFGPRDGGLPGQVANLGRDRLADLFVPDPSEPLDATLSRHGWPNTGVDTRDVNDPRLAEAVAARAPSLIVFSGFGGQIVRQPLFALDVPLLHCHAGWLPDYRGSTTLYYSWLAEGACAVTALLLSPEIDAGPILARRRYPAPPPGVDVDYLYDGAIRADLLVRVMRDYAATGRLPPGEPQGPDGRTYYVIHPLLKHLALLQREGDGG